ncbi:MAG: hypothetical protein LBS30_07035 [Planctomycetota bacterium]|jgi:hypothetical protein|nr:hypothetical protein [Planctomycetota bacterium]
MGAVGAVLGGSLLGLGLSGLGSKEAPSYSFASDVHSTMTPSKPATPEMPPLAAETSPVDAAKDNALMEAERDRERQQATLRRRLAREVFTSGLGAGGVANTSRKSLLGG